MPSASHRALRTGIRAVITENGSKPLLPMGCRQFPPRHHQPAQLEHHRCRRQHGRCYQRPSHDRTSEDQASTSKDAIMKILSELLLSCAFNMFKAIVFICVSFPVFQVFSSENLSERSRSFVFETRVQSVLKGAEVITSTKVTDDFSCTFLCLRESRCVSANLERNADENGQRLCVIYATILGTQGAKLNPSDRFDFYNSISAGKLLNVF